MGWREGIVGPWGLGPWKKVVEGHKDMARLIGVLEGVGA